MLHHWEFVDDLDDASPRDLPAALKPVLVDDPSLLTTVASKGQVAILRNSMERANQQAKAYYDTLSLPDNWRYDPAERRRFDEARAACRALLPTLVAAWERLKLGIQQCQQNTTKGHAPRNCPNESYPRLIHLNTSYKERWLALMKEGYLISKPFPRNRLKIYKLGIGRRRGYHHQDIPGDPRVLEPYAMRTYYFLESVSLSPTPDVAED